MTQEWLKARIRKYADDDIRQELAKLNLTWGQQAELVRQGVRAILFGRGDNNYIKTLKHKPDTGKNCE